MIVLSNAAAQTIQPGEYAVLNSVVTRSGCDTIWQGGAGPLHIRCGMYRLGFTGNVGGPAETQPNLVITVDGVPLQETVMTETVALATDVHNVHSETIRRNCFAGAVIAVKNVGTTEVALQANPALTVERVA